MLGLEAAGVAGSCGGRADHHVLFTGAADVCAGAERQSLVPNVPAGDVALLPEGTYYIISNSGDANSVVRSDIRVAAGKLTDVIITHRAAVITLKLVSDKGGEALANTAWSVITPGGDVSKESIGAFPSSVQLDFVS